MENFNELQTTGLISLSKEESKLVNGGWLTAAIIVTIVVSAINNFDDIRHGLSDGWNGRAPRYD
jgi:hypothetical protein